MTKSKKLSKNHAVLKLSMLCMTHLIGFLIGFTYLLLKKVETSYDNTKAIKVLSIILYAN